MVLGTATAGGVTITVTSDPTLARLAIDLTGGTVGDQVFVLRRDQDGATDVRAASEGLLWQAGSPTLIPTFYDYEARQGYGTDYRVVTGSGAPIVSVHVTVPSWGTWLKSPGKPFLNVKCLWKGDSEYARAPQRTLLRPLGAKYPVAISTVRSAPSGTVKLATMTDEDARKMTAVVADGLPLMIDVDASFGVPVRYVSVGDFSGVRAVDSILDHARYWTLEVDEIAAPVGLAAGEGWTYADLRDSASNYRALAALYANYSDMAAGIQV